MKKRNKKEEFEVIATGNMAKIEKAIKEYAFSSSTQLLLLAPENSEVLQVYLALRKPCKKFVKEVLTGNYDKSIVERSVIGNSLDEENEILLVENYPEFVVRYTEENPSGPYLHNGAYEIAQENEDLGAIVQEYPHQEATILMGSMFSPEMLAKLGL